MPAVVRLDDVSVYRRGPGGERRNIVDSVSWSVAEGEHWALLGPNGAGKTTLLRLASAQLHPTSGTVELFGTGRVRVPHLRHRIGVADLAVTARFFPTLRTVDVVLTGVTGTSSLLEEHVNDERTAKAHELLALVQMDSFSERLFSGLSQGERARVMLARALMTDAALLALDEAGAGLDLPGRELFISSIGRVARERPALATIVATHHVEELSPITSHALLLRDGGVVAAGPIEDTLSDAAMSECFGMSLRVEHRDGRIFARATG